MVCYPHLVQNLLQFVVNHTVKGFGIDNKAAVDVFLELSCFFDDPVDVGNLSSGSFAFSKSSLNIWKFTGYEVLKTGLENFMLYFASVWDVCNCVGSLRILWHCLSLGLEWKLTFSSPVATAVVTFYSLVIWSGSMSVSQQIKQDFAKMES